MRILICRPNLYLKEELTEYFSANGWESDLASDPGSIYQSLSQRQYELILYYVSSLDDFAVIRYINSHYPDLRVVIASDSGFAAGIENVRQGDYTSLGSSGQLGQLRELMTMDAVHPTGDPVEKPITANSLTQSRH